MKLTAGLVPKDYRHVLVELDGDVVEDVIEADDVAGYVVCLARNQSGDPIVDGEVYEKKLMTGKVVFRFP